MKTFSKKSISTVIIVALFGLGRLFWGHLGCDAAGESVIVTQVYDGDTIVVNRGRHKTTTIRLIGVDTPETVKPDHPVEFYGPEASDFTRRSLEGKQVSLEFEPNRPGGDVDAYGRTLAYVITGDGKNFDLELVRLGYGRAYTKFPFKYLREFKAAERAAREAGLGLWSRSKRTEWSDPEARGNIVGNLKSRIYHLPGQYGHTRTAEKNKVYFKTEEDAIKAGFRKAKY